MLRQQFHNDYYCDFSKKSIDEDLSKEGYPFSDSFQVYTFGKKTDTVAN
jgi:hypothetical protein